MRSASAWANCSTREPSGFELNGPGGSETFP